MNKMMKLWVYQWTMILWPPIAPLAPVIPRQLVINVYASLILFVSILQIYPIPAVVTGRNLQEQLNQTRAENAALMAENAAMSDNQEILRKEVDFWRNGNDGAQQDHGIVIELCSEDQDKNENRRLSTAIEAVSTGGGDKRGYVFLRPLLCIPLFIANLSFSDLFLLLLVHSQGVSEASRLYWPSLYQRQRPRGRLHRRRRNKWAFSCRGRAFWKTTKDRSFDAYARERASWRAAKGQAVGRGYGEACWTSLNCWSDIARKSSLGNKAFFPRIAETTLITAICGCGGFPAFGWMSRLSHAFTRAGAVGYRNGRAHQQHY